MKNTERLYEKINLPAAYGPFISKDRFHSFLRDGSPTFIVKFLVGFFSTPNTSKGLWCFTVSHMSSHIWLEADLIHLRI